MKIFFHNLLKNPLLHMFLGGVFAHTAFVAVILVTLQLPPDSILDSGLQEVLLVFEG